MIFYSRENGRDGEKDYLDTNDFKDVFFEKDNFKCLSENGDKVEIKYALDYVEGAENILFKATASIGSDSIEKVYTIEEPYLLVEQGAQAYYDEVMLDDIELIKTAKSNLLEEIRTEVINRGMLLIGVEMDTMALLSNGGNTISCLDNITVNSRTSVSANRHFSILDIKTITSGDLTIFVSDTTALVGKIEKIEESNNKVEVTFSNSEMVQMEAIEFVKPSLLEDREAYDENRVKFISVESASEPEFDEFDDLF